MLVLIIRADLRAGGVRKSNPLQGKIPCKGNAFICKQQIKIIKNAHFYSLF